VHQTELNEKGGFDWFSEPLMSSFTELGIKYKNGLMDQRKVSSSKKIVKISRVHYTMLQRLQVFWVD
jgi:hypothetical protein